MSNSDFQPKRTFLTSLSMSTKILIPVLFLLIVGNIVGLVIATVKMQDLSEQKTTQSLNMLTDSIFLTLRTAMNTGDVENIKLAEENSRKNIKGLKSLEVSKSKKVMELFGSTQPYTTDKVVLKAFESKTQEIIDQKDAGMHLLKIVRPMVATEECIKCHANQVVGETIGVISLTFSVDEADALINKTAIFLLIASLVVILVTTIVVLYLTQKLTYPILEFQKGLGFFFKYINNEKEYIKPFKVHSYDEVGQMVHSVNIEIEKTTSGLAKDEATIKQAALICQEAALGKLNVKITDVAKNPSINELKSVINGLLDGFNYNVSRILTVLREYEKENYIPKIVTKGKTTGEIKELFEMVNSLGVMLEKMSLQNLQNGIYLQQDATSLSENVEKITEASVAQANDIALTTTKTAKIAESIKQNSQNSSQMALFANDLMKNAHIGNELARKTAASMDDISSKVSAINQAIEVIDQIAFQTNILSLNAAVEAASAGEAGKGFAVVAGEVRNLANSSANAAKQIKELVESANTTANDGKLIASEMTRGYANLNNDVQNTIELIKMVATLSGEQEREIVGINKTLDNLNISTQENTKMAVEATQIAQNTTEMALVIVEEAKKKNFTDKQLLEYKS